MLEATEKAVRAVCSTDTSITAGQLRAGLAELKGDGTRELAQDAPERAYSPRQVAALKGCSLKTVGKLASQGLLIPIYSGAGRKRATAYTGASVRAFLEGKAEVRA